MRSLIVTLWIFLFLGPSALAAPPISDVPIPQSLGVSMHFLDLQLPSHMDYLEKSHIGWVRRDLFWDHVEQEKGVYDFTLYDHLIDTLHSAGIRILLILDYNNPLYNGTDSPNDAEGRAAFARFAAAAAKRYAGRVDAWEIYNEPNNKEFWKPKVNADQFVALSDQATAAIRGADPDAVILGPALMGPTSYDASQGSLSKTFAYLRQVLASKGAKDWSGITIHPYREPREPPEGVFPQIDTTRKLMVEAGIDPKAVPVIIGEWGYSSFEQGVDEETQAAYAVRSFLIASIEHMPFSIWYDWQDDGVEPHNNEHHFGLLRHGTLWEGDLVQRVVKPSYTAVQQMGDILDGFRVEKVLRQDKTVLVVSFKQGDETAYAAWSADDKPHDIKLPLPQGAWNATPLLGPSRQVTVTGSDGLPLTTDKMPLLITAAAPQP